LTPAAFRVAIVGAESTGKTTLGLALAGALTQRGLRTTYISEALRAWCAVHQRTPRREEQAAIAFEQARQVAACNADICISDTTPLMTAVYSELLFADTSLTPWAVAEQATFHLTLLTGLDIVWEADGLQRDGPHVREPVDRALRQLLSAHQLPHQVITGQGDARTHAALQCVLQALSMRGTPAG
jgi:nicotinamide riboside kinase